jgi:hypothetical protein
MKDAAFGKVIFLLLSGGGERHDLNEVAQRETWAKTNPPWAEIFWLKADATLRSVSVDRPNRIIWIPSPENYGNLLLKTVVALRYLIEHESFSYVIRSNTSNYFVLPEVLKKLKDLPRAGLYGGQNMMHVFKGRNRPWFQRVRYISGAGIWMTRDLVLKVADVDTMKYRHLVDDVAIGAHLKGYPILEVKRVNIGDFEPLAPCHSLRVKSELHAPETVRRMYEVHQVFNSPSDYVLKQRLKDFDKSEIQLLSRESAVDSRKTRKLVQTFSDTFECRLGLFSKYLSINRDG